MVTLTFTPPSSPILLHPKPPLSPRRVHILVPSSKFLPLPFPQRNIRSGGICRAELSHDAPFAAAIGACLLSTLVLPTDVPPKDEDSDSAIDSTDTRFTVMGIISFIPYFNWLSWVFAWLDTGKRRYAFYALAYLAPYLRSNMALSPEESWLPIASIILGAIHVQLEASIRNGDIQGFQVFSDAAKFVTSVMQKRDNNLMGHQGESGQEREEYKNLPSTEEQTRDEIRWKGGPRHPSEHREHSHGGWDDDDNMKE
ncbi:hypothetical protein Tsubulata_005926 [Turnera subulata]|uniref:Uncharacterized protein n=1 Tax=Turnera subulata TaxID=218843 RepID=A0A9Q0JMH7_9ROSI|nr:hypothetical protein Tsubulata_005926 [Turnera subulata]